MTSVTYGGDAHILARKSVVASGVKCSALDSALRGACHIPSRGCALQYAGSSLTASHHCTQRDIYLVTIHGTMRESCTHQAFQKSTSTLPHT